VPSGVFFPAGFLTVGFDGAAGVVVFGAGLGVAALGAVAPVDFGAETGALVVDGVDFVPGRGFTVPIGVLGFVDFLIPDTGVFAGVPEAGVVGVFLTADDAVDDGVLKGLVEDGALAGLGGFVDGVSFLGAFFATGLLVAPVAVLVALFAAFVAAPVALPAVFVAAPVDLPTVPFAFPRVFLTAPVAVPVSFLV